MPAKLYDYLSASYCCRCDSVVFPDSTGRKVQCWVSTNALAEKSDYNDIPMAIHCCSYKCFKLIEGYLRWVIA